MVVRTLLVRVECGEKTCGGCPHVVSYAGVTTCELFEVELPTATTIRSAQCLAAQREAEAMEGLTESVDELMDAQDDGHMSLAFSQALNVVQAAHSRLSEVRAEKEKNKC